MSEGVLAGLAMSTLLVSRKDGAWSQSYLYPEAIYAIEISKYQGMKGEM